MLVGHRRLHDMPCAGGWSIVSRTSPGEGGGGGGGAGGGGGGGGGQVARNGSCFGTYVRLECFGSIRPVWCCQKVSQQEAMAPVALQMMSEDGRGQQMEWLATVRSAKSTANGVGASCKDGTVAVPTRTRGTCTCTAAERLVKMVNCEWPGTATSSPLSFTMQW